MWKIYHGRKYPSGAQVEVRSFTDRQNRDGKCDTYPLRLIAMHSSTGFDWGANTAGGMDLAYAILLDLRGEKFAKFNYQLYANGFVACFKDTFDVDEYTVIEGIERARKGGQSKEIKKGSSLKEEMEPLLARGAEDDGAPPPPPPRQVPMPRFRWALAIPADPFDAPNQQAPIPPRPIVQPLDCNQRSINVMSPSRYKFNQARRQPEETLTMYLTRLQTGYIDLMAREGINVPPGMVYFHIA